MRWSAWWGVFFGIYSLTAEGGDFYRCNPEQGPAVIFPVAACQRLADPTQPPAPAVSPPSLPSPPPVVAPPPPPVTRAGPWTLSQLLLNDAEHGTNWQAVINNRRVSAGAQIDGGRVQEITRTHVLITHAGGESRLIPGRETHADGFARPEAISLTLDELGLDSSASRLLLLQRIAAGQELLIMHNGIPLARLQPMPK
ncbi:MAG: hypothetical protein HQM06_04425 [Magnetococcales bacterium]|nr:hypothetical protein [Magnetococcales bacterium]